MKTKNNCIIVGAGTYGQVYAEYLKQEYSIEGFIDDDDGLRGAVVNGINVIGNTEDLFRREEKDIAVFVPIGNNCVRVSLLDKLNAAGFQTPNYIHPSANIHSNVILGKAVYILQGVIIMPHTRLEDYVMISAGSIISHHSTIEVGCFISFGVNVGASLTLKQKAYLGIGCTVMTGVKSVGGNSLIGAGAVIIRDVPDGATVVGNPGKIIKIKDSL